MASQRSKADSGRSAPAPGEVYLEFIPVDKAVRVAAVDSATGTEVVFTAPANEPRHRIEALAIAKLERRMALDASASAPSAYDVPSAPANKRKGRLV